MARLGFCGACPTETETSRREAGFPRVFCAYKPICMDCTLLHNGGRSTVWCAYPKEERAVILRDPLLFNLGPPARLATCAERGRGPLRTSHRPPPTPYNREPPNVKIPVLSPLHTYPSK